MSAAELNDERLPPRFWSKVELGEDGCWNWTGAKAGPGERYGYLKVEGRSVRAHRFAYLGLVGPIPEGLQLDHLCRNRACVNPAHLEPVTNRENGLRGESPAAHAARRTRCTRGHAFDDENTAIYNGKRYCKTCNRQKAAAAYERKKRAHPAATGSSEA